MNKLFLLNGAVQLDSEVQRWLHAREGDLGERARRWFSRIRDCGDDVLELLHDGCPVACVSDVPFTYVNIFKAHMNVGFYMGAELPDPDGILEGTGKRMRHVKVRASANEMDASIGALIDAAYFEAKSRIGWDMSDDVKKVFQGYPANVRMKLFRLRELIYQSASTLESVGRLTETLKWGEPAYLTEESKSGSTIRVGWKKSAPTQYAMYFNCQTNLVDTFRTLIPELTYDGNRAIIFEDTDSVPSETISRCIEMALTYHKMKKSQSAPIGRV